MGEIIKVERLNEAIEKAGIKVDFAGINKRLLLMHLMSAVAYDLGKEIEGMLNDTGLFKFKIRQNHREIMRLLVNNTKELFKVVGNDYDKLDAFGQDCDTVERILKKWIGINNDSDEK